MKVMDIKPEPKTAWGLHDRWVNHMVGLGQMLNPRRKQIPVQEIDKLDCKGHGRKECERIGYHTWFHHATDSYYQDRESNLPEGLQGDTRYDS